MNIMLHRRLFSVDNMVARAREWEHHLVIESDWPPMF